jgi:hypothetical protein
MHVTGRSRRGAIQEPLVSRKLTKLIDKPMAHSSILGGKSVEAGQLAEINGDGLGNKGGRLDGALKVGR